MGKKRTRSDEDQGSQKKRGRVDQCRKSLKKENTDSKTVALDELPWSSVSLPDKIENAEGFYGLEEVSDVEVISDSKAGRFKFRVVTNEPKRIGSKTLKEKEKSDIPFHVNTQRQGYVAGDEDEWEGFGSSSVEEKSSTVHAPRATFTTNENRQRSKSGERMKKKRPHNAKSCRETDGHKIHSANSFGALQNTIIQEGDMSAWESLGLSSHTISSLVQLEFACPTPIQKSAIPEILNGHDVIGKAVTGSGKTLAYGIPILEHFLRTRDSEDVKVRNKDTNRLPPVALILSPTRELAHQISQHIAKLCSSPLPATPSVATLTGGLSLQKQKRLLAKADIVIGTPGRLWETISESYELIKWLASVKFVVVDEADRLLSEGHFKEVEEILKALDRKDDQEVGEENQIDTHLRYINDKYQRQTLVFSATFQKNLQQKLAGRAKSSSYNILDEHDSMKYLMDKLRFREDNPKFINVNPVSQMAEKLKEGIVECGAMEKDLYLYALLLHYPKSRTLIFANSITSVRRLTPFLQNLNIPAHALHSQMLQKARLRSVEQFSSLSSPYSVLVATDVAARGLDIPLVQLVIHYHLPRSADMYVHRSGRTARATESGLSILLCAPEEVLGVRRLVAKVHVKNAKTEESKKLRFFMQTIDLNRRIILSLKPRVALSKKISDSSLAREKKGYEDNWLKIAANDLGVDYDSEDFEAGDISKKGRGRGRKNAEKAARELSKADLGALRGQLKQMLEQRVNVGVSERYLTAGEVDIEELLSGERRSEFLGRVDGGGF